MYGSGALFNVSHQADHTVKKKFNLNIAERLLLIKWLRLVGRFNYNIYITNSYNR